jgi:NADH-quinone oxidoreductase subunit A
VIDYLPILAMFVLAGLFAGLSFFASGLLAPKRPTAAKLAPYECGIVPDREPAQRFPVRFYLVAMLFIIFDIEVIFLYPWAVIYRQLHAFGLWEMVLFAVAVFVSFIYLIGNGVLDWGPVRRLTPLITRLPAGAVSAERTAETTVHRVGAGSSPREPAA